MVRFVAVFLVVGIGLAAACSNSNGANGANGTDDAGTQHGCDGVGGCGDQQKGCTACAENGPCLDSLNACNRSTDCLDYGTCLEACLPGDDSCVSQCEDAHQAGAQTYQTLYACVYCTTCGATCAASAPNCP